MNEHNRHSQPFIMVLAVTLVLLVLSQVSTEFNILGFKAKKVDPLGDVLLKGKVKLAPLSVKVVNDSIIAKDSTAIAIRSIDPANIIDPGNDTISALAHFFGALNEIKKQK